MESFHDIPFQMITMIRNYYLGILDDKTLRVDTQPRRLRGTVLHLAVSVCTEPDFPTGET
jgi:hypothetical protein